MAGEYKRKRGRKIIRLPSGETVTVPALMGIGFIDPVERYQETDYSIDNSIRADRKVHVDEVFPVAVDRNGAATSDPPIKVSNNSLKVERVDIWKILDPHDRYQEHHVFFDNVTGGDLLPPHFSKHNKSHIYRYYKDPDNPNDSGPWIDVEMLDSIVTVDGVERFQGKIHRLSNPTNADFDGGNKSGQADPDDPDITIGVEEGTTDNPVRLDPFQNIVNFYGAQGGDIITEWTFPQNVVNGSASGATCSPVVKIIPPDGLPCSVYIETVDYNSMSFTPPAGVTISGDPTITPSSFSYGAWEVFGLQFGSASSVSLLSATFPVQTQPIHDGGEDCFGYLGNTNGATVGGYTISSEWNGAGSITVDISGVTATKDGDTYEVVDSVFSILASVHIVAVWRKVP